MTFRYLLLPIAALSFASLGAGQKLVKIASPAGRLLNQAPTSTFVSDGSNLLRTDGTLSGTTVYRSLGTDQVNEVAQILNKVFLSTGNSASGVHHGLAVYDTRGTGTSLVSGSLRPFDFKVVRGRLLFKTLKIVPQQPYIYDQWSTDGTLAGTGPVAIPFDTSNSPKWRLHGDIIFSVPFGQTSTLYRSDGVTATSLTTVPIHASAPGYDFLAASTGSKVYFAKRVRTANMEINEPWVTDGTPAGTRRVFDPQAPGNPIYHRLLGVIGEDSYFVGYFLGNPRSALWKTDGTAAGTTAVTALPGAVSGTAPADTTGGFYFRGADAGTRGFEPMFTDGTAAGTVLLGDLTPGSGHSPIFHVVPLGGRTALLHFNGTGADSIWISSGTAASTRRIADLSAFSRTVPGFLTHGRYIFTAIPSAGGSEVWALEELAGTQQVGLGSPANSSMRLSATPPVMGASMTRNVVSAPASANGILLTGSVNPWVIALWRDTRLYVDLSLPTIAGAIRTDATGAWSQTLTVPNATNLLGVSAAMQLAIGPTANPIGFDLSNGLILAVGR